MLPLDDLESPGFDPSLLPPGDTAVFNDVIHFLPGASTGLLPGAFAWKGFPLGKMDKSGNARTDAYLHSLMPVPEQAHRRGLSCLDVEGPEPLLALIRGQSLSVDASGPETGLYFRGLPLCRLTLKGRRAILPPRRD